MMSQNRKLIAIVGPTASGKTNLARFLADEFNGELVSADSRQVYKRLDIGSGKDGVIKPNTTGSELIAQYPELRYLDDIPQWLIDIIEPTDRFTTADFQQRALDVIRDIRQRGKLPIIVGGTGLYISALIEGYQFYPLAKRSPNNPRHADKQNWQKTPPNWDVWLLGIDIPQPELYQRIDDRLDQRIKEGLIQEAKNLINEGLPIDRLRELGLEYKYLADRLEEKLTPEQFTTQLKSAIHAFSRRQLSWWRSHGPVKWVKNPQEASSLVTTFLSQFS